MNRGKYVFAQIFEFVSHNDFKHKTNIKIFYIFRKIIKIPNRFVKHGEAILHVKKPRLNVISCD